MTDKYMGEIYQTVETALLSGQSVINVSIYPFKMTNENMLRYRNSSHYAFGNNYNRPMSISTAQEGLLRCQSL